MSRLYRAAHTVRVWLGQEEDNSALAMDIVRRLAYRPDSPEERQSWEYLVENPGKTHRPGGTGRKMIEIKQPDSGPVISDVEKTDNYEALIKLFQRQWFSRVWIQQEAALPENVEVHCGAETCSWETLMCTADMLAYFVDECHLPMLQTALLRERENASSFRSCFSRARAIGDLRKEHANLGESYSDFESLITTCRNCQATDPRDKVYALLPMTSPDEFELDADYTRNKKEAYMSMVNNFLERDSLAFLKWCQNPTCSTGLPSWIPDLEAPWQALPIERLIEDLTYTRNDDSSGTNAPVDVKLIESKGKLEVKGIVFDSIEVVNQDDHVTGNTSNTDVDRIVRQWQMFEKDQREKLEEQWRSEEEEQQKQCRDLSEYKGDDDNDKNNEADDDYNNNDIDNDNDDEDDYDSNDGYNSDVSNDDDDDDYSNDGYDNHDYDDDDDDDDDDDYGNNDDYLASKLEQSYSIYCNLTEEKGEAWRDRMTGDMRNRELSRHKWDDDDYDDFNPAAIDNDPILKIFRRYLPIGKARMSDFLGRKKQFYPWFRSVSVGRRFMVTSKGGSGLVPEMADAGDALCYFAGCSTPFVIRPVGGDDWTIVGVPHFTVTIALHTSGLGLEPRIISLV